MKIRIEKERTYWKKEIKKPKEELYTIIKEITGESVWQIKYREFVEFRYKDKDYDKSKYVFKVNHGNLYYRTNMKKRISDPQNDIQIYEEKISSWKNIEELNNFNFIEDLQYICFKRAYTSKCIYEGKNLKISLQVVNFLDYNCHNVQLFNYLEVENIEDLDIKEKIDNIVKKYEYNGLDLLHCKSYFGKEALGSSGKRKYTLRDIEEQIYNIMLTCTIDSFRND